MDQQLHQESLVSSGLLSSKVQVINFHESLDALQDISHIDSSSIASSPPRAELSQKKNEDLTRFFNSNGDLLFTELVKRDAFPYIIRRYYDLDLTLLRLEERSMDGSLRHVRRFMAGSQNPLSESYISKTGFAYLTTWYRGDGSVICIIDHTKRNDQLSPDISRLDILQSSWFSDIVRRTPEATVIIDDPYSFNITKSALPFAKRRILTLHSNTFVNPNDPMSGINAENREILESVSQFDQVVVSTESQCKDLQGLYPDCNFIPIPQLVKISDPESLSHVDRDSNLLIYVGRLEAPKQLLELIDAIAPLFVSFPELRFEIYGEGNLKPNIVSKIRELKLGNFVKLMGRTETPLKEFARANLSVLATRFEGFGLSIAESMLVGTPVIAFDCRYGPSDMIEDKISGRLVTAQDFSGIVDTLIQLQSNQRDIEAMRPFAKKKIEELCDASINGSLWHSVVAPTKVS